MARANNDAPLEFACTCGRLRGHIAAPAIATGTRVVCYCADCRASELYLNQPDPAPGPVDLFQTTPDAITLTQGARNLGALRISPRGPLRWYATCCNAPLCNTLATPALAFAAIRTARISAPDRLGKVRVRGFVPLPGGRTKHQGIGRMVISLVIRMLGARLSGRWRETAFFDPDTGDPVARITILSKQERSRLYP